MQNVLIIEDDQSQSDLIKKILKINGFNTFAVKSGENGLSYIGDEIPDLILCDINLPGIDGFNILNTIRNNPKTNGIPFIIITGNSGREYFRKGMELGADDFLIKPFTEKELVNSIESRLNLIKMRIRQTNKPVHQIVNFEDQMETLNKIYISLENESKLINFDDLICISAVGDYSSIIVNDGSKHIIKKTMKWWENKLPSRIFCRIHRSTIINLKFVKRIERWINKAQRVYMENITKPFIISRRYNSKFKARLSN